MTTISKLTSVSFACPCHVSRVAVVANVISLLSKPLTFPVNTVKGSFPVVKITAVIVDGISEHFANVCVTSFSYRHKQM